MGTLFQIFFVFNIFGVTTCDYDCLCTYSVETKLYNKPSLNSSVAGYLYEFDCKPIFTGNAEDFTGFHVVQFKHKVVYVEKSSSVLVQICQGSVPLTDKATLIPETLKTTTSTTKTVSVEPAKLTTKYITAKSTNYTLFNKGTTLSSTSLPSIGTKQSSIIFSSSSFSNTRYSSLDPKHTGIGSSGLTNLPRVTTTQVSAISKTTSNIGPKLAPTTNRTVQSVGLNTTGPLISTKPFVTTTTSAPTHIPTYGLFSKLSTAGTTFTKLTTTKPQHCPKGWILFQTSCYKFHTSYRTTWNLANGNCLANQAHLVFVNSIEEEAFLKTYLSSHLDLTINDNSDTGTWIGARDNGGSWVWQDSLTSTDIPPIYSHWRHGQPDSDSQDCVGMIGRQNFEWMDYECSQLMFFICEKSLNVPKPNLFGTKRPYSVQTDCEKGWTSHQDSCYRFVTEHGRIEWNPANKFCVSLNSHLVIIETAEEDRFLRSQMQLRINTDNDDEEETGVWTAGTDQDVEDRWVWRNSLRHTDTPISGYKNWYPGEPDSGDNEKEEDCLCLIGNKGFQWQDYRCRDNMYFICEKSRSVSVAFVG